MRLNWLVFNHVDAWGMTFIIAALALALRGALALESLAIPAALALGAWFAFALNDRFDVAYDAADGQKARRNAFVGGGWQYDAVLAAAFAGLAVLYAGFGGRGVAAGLGGLAAAWAYSAPPLRLKSRPGFDLFTHAAFVETFPYLAAILLAGAALTAFDALAWVILALASLSAQLEQQARDFEVDSRFERNFTALIGLQAAHRLMQGASALLLGAGVFGVAGGIIPAFVWPGMAMTIPMIAHRLIRPAGTPRSETLIRVSMAAGALYIAAVVALTV